MDCAVRERTINRWADSHTDMQRHKGIAARVMSRKDQGGLGLVPGGTRAHIPARIISGLVILKRGIAGTTTARHQLLNGGFVMMIDGSIGNWGQARGWGNCAQPETAPDEQCSCELIEIESLWLR